MRFARTIRQSCFLALFALGLAVPGCGGSTPVEEEDFSDLDGADLKADKFRSKISFLGTIQSGEIKDNIEYTGNSKYLAYKLKGRAGNRLEIMVMSWDYVQAWLLNSKFQILARTEGDDSEAEISYEVTKDATYYLVFRETTYAPTTFWAGIASISKPTPDPSITTDFIAKAKATLKESIDNDTFEWSDVIPREELPGPYSTSMYDVDILEGYPEEFEPAAYKVAFDDTFVYVIIMCTVDCRSYDLSIYSASDVWMATGTISDGVEWEN